MVKKSDKSQDKIYNSIVKIISNNAKIDIKII